MILTPSDVALLARKASFWELAEYISEALVGLGCLGEYIAEYTKWPAKWTNEQRHRLGRRSLLLLIVGIGAGLWSLIQTNALSGEVIGSLGEQIKEASKKAKLLEDSANSALVKSGEAVTASGKAVEQSDKAEKASSSALALARGARHEADSFEADIKSAKAQSGEAKTLAGEAKSLLSDVRTLAAQAQERASEATAGVNRINTPRSLINVSQLVDTLRPFNGTEFIFASVFSDDESIRLLKQIDNVLGLAGWKRLKHSVMNIGIPAIQISGRDDLVNTGVSTGVHIEVDSLETVEALQALSRDKLPSHVRIALLLNELIFAHLSPPEVARPENRVDIASGSSTLITRIMHGAARLTAEPASRSCSSLTDRPILR